MDFEKKKGKKGGLEGRLTPKVKGKSFRNQAKSQETTFAPAANFSPWRAELQPNTSASELARTFNPLFILLLLFASVAIK